jgi:hypothetical protein
VPKHIQTRDGIVNLVDEARIESLHTSHACPAFAFAAEQNETRAPKHLSG